MKQPPRAQPKLWHILSCAAWDKFGLDSAESRKRCAKVREAAEARREPSETRKARP